MLFLRLNLSFEPTHPMKKRNLIKGGFFVKLLLSPKTYLILIM